MGNQQNQALADMSLKIAQFFKGYKESTGNNDGPLCGLLDCFIVGSFNSLGWMQSQPWCAAFASFCIYLASAALGITCHFPKSAASTEIWAWAVAGGYTLPKPIPGCVGLLKASAGSGKTHDHTFRVTAVNSNGSVSSFDGNWSNAAGATTHPIDLCDFVMVA